MLSRLTVTCSCIASSYASSSTYAYASSPSIASSRKEFLKSPPFYFQFQPPAFIILKKIKSMQAGDERNEIRKTPFKNKNIRNKEGF